MQETTFSGYNDEPLHLYVWDEVKTPKGVIQLSHGMAEHMGRYDGFARYMNGRGYVVLGEDHRAHGKTSGVDNLGKAPKGDCFANTIDDLIMISYFARENYRFPLILFGHSYGSFLAQGYLEQASKLIDGAVLCGSACQNGLDVKAGRIVADVQNAFLGGDKPAKLIRKLSFGAYDKQFKNEKKSFAWGNRDDAEREKYLADPMCDFTLSIGFYKSFFNGVRDLYDKETLSAIRKDIPLLLISGDKDPVGGNGKSIKRLYNKYKKVGIEDVTLKLYPDARHELLNEINKAEVMEDVAAFCDGCVGGAGKRDERTAE